MRVLILGGTAEARELAAGLVRQRDVQVLTSLAGAVATPLLPDGDVRIGGFGGATGLAQAVREWRADVVVDATHPFAADITAHAVTAAGDIGTPLLVVRRAAWTASPGDHWIDVEDLAGAARVVRALEPGTVLLTTGRRGLAEFADDTGHEYVLRSIEPPAGPRPTRLTWVGDRGPYTVDGELALLAEHHVSALVSRNSGGAMTESKLVAARQRSLPIVMVRRRPLPDGVDPLPDVAAVQARLAGLADR